MGGRIDTILMSVNFGDDPISTLDFSFTGGVPLKSHNIRILRGFVKFSNILFGVFE